MDHRHHAKLVGIGLTDGQMGHWIGFDLLREGTHRTLHDGETGGASGTIKLMGLLWHTVRRKHAPRSEVGGETPRVGKTE